ncbi:nuclear transport factor 2 family protein [Pseudomaricurvus alkylphenolicus]|uniref:nuclear transport factor 2 family protein n=1 Tax=Pseudomaricurvus alkylphenolicus TaxID=1306991 RepID=UPI00141D86D9|nr:nuclear transport factor 2 family protein [Pseudomaricurvus alkylphenolicus]NIB44076.1 nuclear transport factor 2 family protein [Pseudomaricurvus alkylphenolicus]
MNNTKSLEFFLHRQVECWNNSDKAGFLQCYKDIAPNGLSIEYVGQPSQDPWLMLEGMWREQPNVRIDVVACVVCGNESASHHNNVRNNDNPGTRTLEFYTLKDGKLSARIFISNN